MLFSHIRRVTPGASTACVKFYRFSRLAVVELIDGSNVTVIYVQYKFNPSIQFSIVDLDAPPENLCPSFHVAAGAEE